MANRNWKHARATSMPHAMELCLAYARGKHNRSVDQVADLMGLPSKWRLYKWVEDASIPARYLLSFEHACGADFVTQYQAHSSRRLLINIPTGRNVATSADLHELQRITNDAVGVLIAFADGQAEAEETITALTLAMEGLARRDFSLKVKERILMAGFALILMLMVTVIFNDVARLLR